MMMYGAWPRKRQARRTRSHVHSINFVSRKCTSLLRYENVAVTVSILFFSSAFQMSVHSISMEVSSLKTPEWRQ